MRTEIADFWTQHGLSATIPTPTPTPQPLPLPTAVERDSSTHTAAPQLDDMSVDPKSLQAMRLAYKRI